MLVTYLINKGIVLSNGDNARKQFILTNLCSNVKEAFRHILNSLKSVHRINQHVMVFELNPDMHWSITKQTF